MANSVLRIGLLPGRIWGDAQQQASISVASEAKPANSRHSGSAVGKVRHRRDAAHAQARTAPGSQNRPSLANAELDPRTTQEKSRPDSLRYIDSFSRIAINYSLPMDRLRALPTIKCGFCCGPPELMQFCWVRASIPTCCATPWIGTAVGSALGSCRGTTYLAQAIPAERDDMQRADIPIFSRA